MPIPIATPAPMSRGRLTCERLAMSSAKVDTTTAIAIESAVIQTS
jgi:hypothetical protein